MGGAFYDGTATCADHVKATPTECAENRWQNHVCCGSCVAEGKATTKAGNPVVPLVAGAWAYSGPASSEIPAGPIGRRRVQDSDSHAKQRTLMVVLRATDGASALSVSTPISTTTISSQGRLCERVRVLVGRPHEARAEHARCDPGHGQVMNVPFTSKMMNFAFKMPDCWSSFQAVCNNDYQLDDVTTQRAPPPQHNSIYREWSERLLGFRALATAVISQTAMAAIHRAT